MKSAFLPLLLTALLSAASVSAADPVPFCLKGKCGFVSKGTRKFVIKPAFRSVKEFSEGLAPVLTAGKWGFVNVKGVKVVDAAFGEIKKFSGGYCAVMKKGLWGYIDQSGRTAVPFEYEEALNSDGNAAPAKKGGKWGVIKISEKNFFPTKYDEILPFSGGLARMKLGGEYGYLDREGKEVSSPVYDELSDFSDGYATARMSLDYGFISRETMAFKKKGFEQIGPYNEGLAPAKRVIDGQLRCGYVDAEGNEKMPFEHLMCVSFSEGLASVLKNLKGKWGFIDKTGKQAVSPKYDTVFGFKNGICKVVRGEAVFYIDSSGFEYR